MRMFRTRSQFVFPVTLMKTELGEFDIRDNNGHFDNGSTVISNPVVEMNEEIYFQNTILLDRFKKLKNKRKTHQYTMDDVDFLISIMRVFFGQSGIGYWIKEQYKHPMKSLNNLFLKDLVKMVSNGELILNLSIYVETLQMIGETKMYRYEGPSFTSNRSKQCYNLFNLYSSEMSYKNNPIEDVIDVLDIILN